MRPAVLLLSYLLSIPAFAGSITGVFQGTVVQLPKPQAQSSKPTPRWLYV